MALYKFRIIIIVNSETHSTPHFNYTTLSRSTESVTVWVAMATASELDANELSNG